jgi:hypothetical protein
MPIKIGDLCIKLTRDDLTNEFEISTTDYLEECMREAPNE